MVMINDKRYQPGLCDSVFSSPCFQHRSTDSAKLTNNPESLFELLAATAPAILGSSFPGLKQNRQSCCDQLWLCNVYGRAERVLFFAAEACERVSCCPVVPRYCIKIPTNMYEHAPSSLTPRSSSKRRKIAV